MAVVGGGAAGCAAALACGLAGFSTVHFAPAAALAPARTAALLQGSLALLRDLGVWDTLKPQAAPLRAIRLVDASRRLLRAPEVLFRAEELGLDAFGANIANAAIVAALRLRAAAEASIREVPAAADGISPHARGVTIEAAGQQWEARLVVAADGAESPSRRAAGIGVRRWRYRQSALVALLGIRIPHDGVSTEFHTEYGPFTLVPAVGDRMSLVWVDSADRAGRTAALADADFARAAEAQAASIHGAMTVEGPRAVFPLRGAIADRFAGNRVMLVGEAAHLFPPIGAQGLNLGFRDVAAMRHVLARHRHDPGSDAALGEYHTARRADIRMRTLAIDLFSRSLLTPFLPVHALRGVGLSLSAAFPAWRRILMRGGLGPRDRGPMVDGTAL